LYFADQKEEITKMIVFFFCFQVVEPSINASKHFSSELYSILLGYVSIFALSWWEWFASRILL